MENKVATTTRAPQNLRQQLSGEYFKQQVALALPKHMTPDRFVRVGLTALMKTPKLMDCTPESVIQCMLNCSALGLEPDGRRAHLIPYGTTCTLIIDYKGIVELAKRSGDVSNVFTQIVCDKDAFTWENGEVKHQIDFRNERGPMYATYAVITFKDGSKQTDVMTKGEVDAIRKRSRASGAGPWVTDYNEMAKKTVFKRASKWIVLSPEIADALEKDDAPFSTTPQIAIMEAPQPQLEEPAIEVEQDQVSGAEMPAQKPAPDEIRKMTKQEQLEQAVTEKGFTYDDFAQWAEATNHSPSATSFGSFSELKLDAASRMLRILPTVLDGIAKGKGATL